MRTRSNRLQKVFKKTVLKKFLKFTGKYLQCSHTLGKVPEIAEAEILQNSRENTRGLQLYLKRDPGTGVFLRILRNL